MTKKFKINETHYDSIVKMFNNGVTIRNIAKELGVSYWTAWTATKNLGLTIKRNAKIQPTQKAVIESLFRDGLSIRAIAAQLKVSTSTIQDHLASLGLSWRERHDALVNHELFNIRSEFSDYYIGLLMADGCNSENTYIIIELQMRDEHILKSLRDKVCPGTNITYPRKRVANTYRSYARLSINSRKLAMTLSEYGLTQRKSGNAKILKIENSRHFWRGLFDGDGSLFYRTATSGGRRGYYPACALFGSNNMMSQFSNHLKESIGVDLKAYRHKTIWQCSSLSHTACKIAKYLYDGSFYHLNRKMTLAAMFAEHGGVFIESQPNQEDKSLFD